MPRLRQRLLGLSAVGLRRAGGGRAMAAGALQALIFMSIRASGPPNDWFRLILHGLLAGAAAVAAVATVGLTAAERQRFLLDPVRRLAIGPARAAAASGS
jgi:hypothetical protein